MLGRKVLGSRYVYVLYYCKSIAFSLVVYMLYADCCH